MKMPIGHLWCIKEARQKGNLDTCFPATIVEGETPQWDHLALKTLKELQCSAKSIEPSAPYILEILEMLDNMLLVFMIGTRTFYNMEN